MRGKEEEEEKEKHPEEERILHLDVSHNVFFSLKLSTLLLTMALPRLSFYKLKQARSV